MSQFDDKVSRYQAEFDEMGIAYDTALLTAVTKSLGPSIYLEDASRVSCSDSDEMARVKKNFLIGKLGLSDAPELDAALKEVCDQLGSSNKNKFRPMFYYLLVKKLGKEAQFV